MKNNVPKVLFYTALLIALITGACGGSAPISGDGYDSAPSNSFVIEAGYGAESFLSPESESGKVIADNANFYTVFYSTNKVKNNLNQAGAKNYDKAHAYILESPHWANISGQTIATSNMVIGMTGDLMRSLGYTPGQPTYLTKGQVADLISSKTINLDVCNPTQCNSGELFYFAMLNHYSGQNILNFDLVSNQTVLDQTKGLLENIDISTSTDFDAKKKFLENSHGYNAIWTYEAEVAQINFTRIEQGLEPIYVVYVDGTIDAAVTLFFSPYYQLTDEDKKDASKANRYKAIFEEYVAIAATFEKDENIRKAIADSGWRPAQYGAQPSADVLKPEWGFVQDPQTSTGFAPKYEIAMALNNTFAQVIRKPTVLIYVGDDSGSMTDSFGATDGRSQLIYASNFIFGPDAESEFLQAINEDITSVYMFDDDDCSHLNTIFGTDTARLAYQIESTHLGGNTSMFRCGLNALDEMAQYKTACETTHECGIVFITDGDDNDCPEDIDNDSCISPTDFNLKRTELGLDFVSVYAIPVGNANMSEIKSVTNVQVCEDAMTNNTAMIDCFKKIKGSN